MAIVRWSETCSSFIITGCSTEFGRALAEAVLKRGGSLLATAHKPEQLRALVEPSSSIAHLFLDLCLFFDLCLWIREL